MKAAFTFLVKAKKVTASTEPTVGIISDADKKNMTAVGLTITDIDEVIFLEFKGQG